MVILELVNGSQQMETGLMASSVATREVSSARRSSLPKLFKAFARLAPKQLTDEINIAVAQLKTKGISAGIAAALLVVALVFLAFLAVALIVAAIFGFSQLMAPWLAALLVAGIFLVIAAVVGLIGFLRLKKTMPLLPEDAIRGLRHDLGVVKEGSRFNPAALDAAEDKPAKKDKNKNKGQEKDSGQKAPEVPYYELLSRTDQRRDRMADVRDKLGPKLDVKAQFARFKAVAGTRVASGRHAAATRLDSLSARLPKGGLPKGGLPKGGLPQGTAEQLRGRWKPLTVLCVSLSAMVVFLRKLLK
jgi:hypothetical protein